VQTLLNKPSHEMIGLDSSFIGSIEKDKETLVKEQKELFETANKNELDKKPKNKMRGRNKISAKLRRKQKNVIDAQMLKLKEMQKAQRDQREQEKTGVTVKPESLGALSRFAKKQ